MAAASDTERIPEELSGGYRRIDPAQATVGADVAVLYTASDSRDTAVIVEGLDPASLYNAANGRNYRTGRVAAVEAVADGIRVEVTDGPDRGVTRLVVEPSREDPEVGAVFAETPARKRLLGRLEALYVADE